MDLTRAIAAEIEAIHETFTAWFNGAAAPDTFSSRIENRFAAAFSMVPPGGQLVERAPLLASLRAAHGSHAGIEIEITGVQVLHDLGDLVIASYEEWQRSPAPLGAHVTARTSTAILRRAVGGWQWVHVHETWLPDEIAQLRSPFGPGV